MIGIWDFRGSLIRLFEDAGFIFHSEVCIWKDPVTAMQRTKAIGLLHKQIKKDSCMSRQGIPDYLVTMRKPGVNASPVDGEFDSYAGEEGTGPIKALPGHTCDTCQGKGSVLSDGHWYRCPDMCKEGMVDKYEEAARKEATRYSIEVWQRYASPVWMDINPSDTLQKESAREHADERHICPLQLQVIDRGIELWSNPKDVVFSPFAGIGSEGYVALQKGRRFYGVELKESYWKQAVLNLKAAEVKQDGLFAGLAEEAMHG